MNDGTRVRVKPTGETGTVRFTMRCSDVVVLLDEEGLAWRFSRFDVEPILEREEAKHDVQTS